MIRSVKDEPKTYNYHRGRWISGIAPVRSAYGDGSHTRSFCFMDDMIDGILEVMRIKTEGPINLGNPAEFTVKELAQKVLTMTASTSKILYKSLPKDDPKQRRPDITLAKKLLRWQPKISLDEGLRRTIEWFSDRKLP